MPLGSTGLGCASRSSISRLVRIWGSGANLLGLINLALAVLGLYGIAKLSRKRKMLKEEQIIFE